MDAVAGKTVLGGGQFLIKDSRPEEVFIPEQFTEEQLMIKSMIEDFIASEIVPNIQKIEKQEDNIAASLLEKLGDLGLLGAHMPEVYGGMSLDNNTNTLIGTTLGPAGSFTVSFAAHIGIGMLPILYFGTEAQKEKYLPRLISGELKASYCLTEPGSGSDALAAKTRADLTDDGEHYILNGQKMWISNAGFADIFIVFAQVAGEKFTGFIVEKGMEGFTLGAEEDKLGIKGSSTRQVFFENVKVPKENLLGEIGKGHLIAFNVLNIGRFKLCALSLGGAKGSADTAVKYANERVQFKVPISSFGAIKHKLAEQAIQIVAGDSALFRVSDLLEQKKLEYANEGISFAEAKLKAAEEYAIECSILKIVGSEVLDFVVDETLQVHGGMGFSEEGTAARGYRDSRINRIYEGTNEINRLLMVDMLLKRAMKGKIDIVGPAWEVQKELASMPSFGSNDDTPYAEEIKAIKDFKKVILMVAGSAAKMQMDGQINLKEEQEIIMNVSDMLTQVFMAESLLLRVQKLHSIDQKIDQKVYDAMLKVFIHDTTSNVQKFAKDALASFAEGDLLRTMMMGLKRFTKYPPQNVKKLRRVVADTMIEANEFIF
ncbi:MAG: acyl-CoA dehydrogenase family protein [Saprospiraceae bacterium]